MRNLIRLPPPSAQKLSRAGSPALGVELQISEQGEILARGNVIMDGYWDQPTATADAIRTVGDGPDATEWFHTGDGGIIDQENYLAISDRKKMSSFLAEKMSPPLKLKTLCSDILKLMRSQSLVFPMKSGEN